MKPKEKKSYLDRLISTTKSAFFSSPSNARGPIEKRGPGRPSGNSSPYVISEHYKKTSLQVNVSQYESVKEISARTGIPIRDLLAKGFDEVISRYIEKGSPVAPRGKSKTVEEVFGPLRYPLDI